jgi:hypothetical protein
MTRKRWLFADVTNARQVPGVLLRSAILGAVTGPIWGIFFSVLYNTWRQILQAPFTFLWQSMVIGVIFVLLFYLFCGLPFVYLRPRFERLAHRRHWPIALSVCAAGGFVAAIIAPKIIWLVLGVQILPGDWYGRAIVIQTILSVAIGLVIGNVKRSQYRQAVRERELETAAAKAEAYALQAQISPHFFFNALNSVSALVPNQPDAAQEMLGRLGDIFRYTFSCGKQETVPLERELAFVREYLLLEKARYRDRLRFELPEAPAIPDVNLPGLTLQPIVENAIRHGISRRMCGGTVRVELEPNGSSCAIHVLNQFDPQDGDPDLRPERVFREEHALANVRERLWLLFGERAGLAFTVDGPEWVRATLTVPCNGAQH